ncbi:MAG: glycosyltransferase family 4 protein [Nanoarchaeota archaeon]|nr:glycosyltransferase family 4 protein [Nanoarchaeota archaeon]
MSSKKSVDVVYVIASQLGTIGIGKIALNALKGMENAELKYKSFSRGYDNKIKLKKKNLMNYSFLEYLTYPFRFIEKFLKININSFRLVNYIFGKLVNKNLPHCKIYHSWMDIAPDAVLKAKKRGAILILEGANSHPLNLLKILNKEYEKLGMEEYIVNPKSFKNRVDSINKFDYVICTSDFVYDSFLERGFSKKQLIKIPYGVDVNKFKIRKKNDKKLKFLFVGSVQIRKGIHILLQAWSELNLKNAELIIVGRVWPDAVNVVEKYKNNKSVKFVGFDSSPRKYFETVNVFISPSLEEGSALTCYEAMASSLPLIATYNSGPVIRDGKDGFVIKANDIGVLKNKIKYFYDNHKAVTLMGKSARKYVKNFTWEDYGKNLTKFYEKILK